MTDIDLVYLWVDGNDPKWVAKRNAYMGLPGNSQEYNAGRYANNDELKYSLRSIEKYAPWIRKIFIVTDNQVPEWLDTSNPKIQIVDHTEIMPPECLPCFNSVVIEHHLHKIPGLSEHFLFSNDDTFINQPVTPETFFGEDWLPKIMMRRKFFRKQRIWIQEKIFRKPLNSYQQTIKNAALLVEKKYGTFYGGRPHHNIDAYLKSSVQHTFEMFRKEINAMASHHIRSREDIQRILYSYTALAEGKGHLCYVHREHSLRLNIHRRKYYKIFERYNPVLFCVNDSEHANNDDRKRAVAFLSELFPEKSQFEK